MTRSQKYNFVSQMYYEANKVTSAINDYIKACNEAEMNDVIVERKSIDMLNAASARMIVELKRASSVLKA